MELTTYRVQLETATEEQANAIAEAIHEALEKLAISADIYVIPIYHDEE